MDLQHTVRRNVVASAVGSAIFCAETGEALDVGSAVLVTNRTTGKAAILTETAFAELRPRIERAAIAVEVWFGSDGREELIG